jgi:RNA polymerase sigma-70 factor (ECF subfamily)
MARVCNGSTRAFGELYDLHSARAYRVARSVCRYGDDAEQAVQEGFVSIYKSRMNYCSERGTVGAWVLSVVRNRAIDLLRSNSRHTTRRAEDTALDAYATSEDVAGHFVERDEASRLRVMIQALPNPQQEVITLAFYGELSHSEIATQLNLPVGTVKGRMRLGMNKLREELQAAA